MKFTTRMKPPLLLLARSQIFEPWLIRFSASERSEKAIETWSINGT